MNHYIPLLNGTEVLLPQDIFPGSCDGTLMTDKIVLTAGHCCKFPFFKVSQLSWTILFPEKCTPVKCKRLIQECLSEPQKPECKWVEKLENLPEDCNGDRPKCMKQAEECISHIQPALYNPQLSLPKRCEWIEEFIKDPSIPMECSALELALLQISCSTAAADCLTSGCDKASEVQHIISLTEKWLPFKNMTVQAG